MAWLKAHLTNSWMASPDFDSTMAHIGWACWILIATALFSKDSLVWCGGISGGLVVFAAVKEFLYDANFELPAQTFKDNMTDFLGYLGGVALGWIVIVVNLFVTHRL